jgi:hypothetical protein
MPGTIGTIIFQNGFDIITSSGVIQRYQETTSFFNGGFETGIYDYGKSRRIFGGSTRYFLNGPVTEFTACCHFFIASGSPQISFGESSEQLKIAVRFNSTTQKVEIYSGSNAGTLVQTSTGSFMLNTWYWVNIYVKIADSGGVVEVRLDNSAATSFVSYSGDTNFGTTTAVNYIQFQSINNGDMRVDNAFVHYGSAYPDNFISERRMLTLVPTGNGGSIDGATGFVPSSGSNWSTVDDSTISISDFNSSNTIGAIDVFTRNSTNLVTEIDSVSHVITAAKDDVGERIIRSVMKIDNTLYESGNISLTANPTSYDVIRQVSPATTSAWENNELNNALIGYKDQS